MCAFSDRGLPCVMPLAYLIVIHFSTLVAELRERHPRKNHNCRIVLDGYGVRYACRLAKPV